MDLTIIGLAHCGKTTLLEALAGKESPGSGIATFAVRDRRVDELHSLFHPRRKVYGEIRAREAAWPQETRGRKSEMEKYMDRIRGSRLFLHVLAGARTPRMSRGADPMRDLKKLDGEMIFADLVSVENLLERKKKIAMEPRVEKLFLRLKSVLEEEKPLWTQALNERERADLSGFNLITLTPQLIVVNTEEVSGAEAVAADFGDQLQGRNVFPLCFPLVREIGLLPPEEQEDFAREMGLGGPATGRVGIEAFRQLDIISFLTVGEDECRAWPIPRGSTARSAAGAVHSDIERGFIRAEVVTYEDFMARKSLKACRRDGVLRLEGKDYRVQDGDIIDFRFNV